jgi:hypothetical protein
MAWDIDDNVFIERDEDNYARHLHHIQSPFAEQAGTDPYDVALAYLEKTSSELDVERRHLEWLGQKLPPAGAETGDTNPEPGPQLRWRARRTIRNGETRARWTNHNGETEVLVIQQTHDIPVRVRLRLTNPAIILDRIVPIPLDVHGAGLRIVMHRRGSQLEVVGATSTLRHNFDFAHARALAESGPAYDLTKHPLILPKRSGAHETSGFDTVQLGPLVRPLLVNGLSAIHGELGLTGAAGAEKGFWIWRHEPSARNQPPAFFLRKHHRKGIQPGADYAVLVERREPFFIDDDKRVGFDTPPFNVVVRLGDSRVLAIIPLSAGALPEGYVFLADPISATGNFELRPNRPSAAFAPVRQRVALHLPEPTPAQPNYRLRGDHVTVLDHTERNKEGLGYGGLGFDPPSEAPGDAFDYDARTNDFAAVNAYWHLDGMFRRLEAFGLKFQSWMPEVDPQLGDPHLFAERAEVIHRAAIQPGGGGDGRVINAQLRVRPGRDDGTSEEKLHRLEFRFALADLSLRAGAPRRYDENGNPTSDPAEGFPLGIACDARWVWHEFGHALIAGATGDLELRFAHSVGDALAAINGDPESALARRAHADKYRGVTFPWVNLPLRRHDRDARLGWSWNGIGRAEGYAEDIGDLAGYRREQVLSSTLFRLYRAAGGDTVDSRGRPLVWRRRQIADYVTYLIARALASFGPAPTIPARDASVFASALMDADAGTTEFAYAGLPPDPVGQRRVGGTLHKVVRWAFEKQGLYAQGTEMMGAPPAVDVFVDDVGGEYDWQVDWHAEKSEVWARRTPDGLLEHQPVRAGRTSYLYLRARNRGHRTAFGATASLHVANADPDLVWPDRRAWRELPPRAPADARADIAPGGSVVVGPFPWTPRRPGRKTILVELNAPGDRSNINPATGLPCASATARPSPLGRLVRFDNNLAARDVQVGRRRKAS